VHSWKDFVAATLGCMCQRAGVVFDACYAARREGGLFALTGSPVIGGHHYYALRRFLTRFRTATVRLGDLSLFAPLLSEAHPDPSEAPLALPSLQARCAAASQAPVPSAVVAIQTENLPEGLRHGVVPYVSPESGTARGLGGASGTP